MFENKALVALALGRSAVRQRILALLLEGPETRLHLREIQRRAHTSPGTASRELGRLVAAGLIDREAEGNQVYFKGSGSPAATLLFQLLAGIPSRGSQPAAPRRPAKVRAVSATGMVSSPLGLHAPPAAGLPVAETSSGASPAQATPDIDTASPSRSGPGTAATPPAAARPLPGAQHRRHPHFEPPPGLPAAPLPVPERQRSIPASLGIIPDRPRHPAAAADARPGDATSAAQPPAAPVAPGTGPDVSMAAPAGPPSAQSATASSGVPRIDPPRIIVSGDRDGSQVPDSRGRIAPRPEGTEVELRIAAIQARGPVDDVGARAGATLAPHLRWLYGGRLRAVYLYGPRATGRSTAESPVELLLVLDGVERYGEELERTSLACASMALELGVVVSRIFVSEPDWAGGAIVRTLPILAGAVAL